MVAKKKVQATEPVKKPVAKPKRRKKVKTVEKKVVLEKEKELIAEEILKEPIPFPKTTGEVVEEAVVPNLEEQQQKVEKKATILSGSFTDISIGTRRFKELEEKLKKLRRF